MARRLERPPTPAVPSPLLQESRTSILSESSGSESDSVSPPLECPCCRLPPVPELSTLAEAIPRLDLNTSATLEERFLKTVAIQPTAGSTVRAAAVVPQDRRAAGYHPLIDLLCHRMFSTFRHQRGIRNFSVYYYEGFLSGDTLTVVSRKVFRRQLSWLEVTVARDSVIVATATALFDAARPEPDGDQLIPTDKPFIDFDGVHSANVSRDRDLW